MRISELAERTGVTLATLKFYVREGLVRGRATAPNQAVYDESHVERVRLIVVLSTTAGLPLASVRRVVELLDDADQDLATAMGAAVSALSPHAAAERVAEHPDADATVDALGIVVPADYPALAQLEEAIAGIRAAGLPWDDRVARRYTDALRPAAIEELAPLSSLDREDAVEYAVLGTALYEPAILALRRLVHADIALRASET